MMKYGTLTTITTTTTTTNTTDIAAENDTVTNYCCWHGVHIYKLI
jgi:hypothetical protein